MSRKKWRSVVIVGLLASLTSALMLATTAGAAPKAGPSADSSRSSGPLSRPWKMRRGR